MREFKNVNGGLKRRLKVIKEKHPHLKCEFMKDAEGLLTGLKYLAESDEEAAEVEALARWAFAKASERPKNARGK